MTKNHKHEQFQKAMQQAWDESILEDYVSEEDIPKPDLSFLDEAKVAMTDEEDMDLQFLLPKRKHTSVMRFTKVAGILFAIFVTSSAIAIFMNSEASYGVKSFIQNVKHLVMTDEPAVNKNGAETLTITDWSEIDKGKKVVGTIYVPEYIPDGFAFQQVTFESVVDILDTTYEYKNGEDLLSISIQTITSTVDNYVSGEPEKSPISGKEMYVEVDEDLGECVITYPNENRSFCVIGQISKDEAFKVIEGITKQGK